jgi:hypothetical protein
MMELSEQLAQCELHTRQAINDGAANRLANWRLYQTENELVQFVQRTIRNQNAMANGWELEQQGLTSLESIVISHQDLFTEDDIQIAKNTLGR